MKVFDWNEIISASNKEITEYFSKGTGISIGSFDGLHQGHRLLLSTLTEGCKKRNLLSGVVSFKRPLPSFKHPENYQGDLTSLDQRINLFESAGLDFAIIVDFNNEFAAMTGVQFLKKMIELCSMKYIAEGVDFRFGYKGSTDISGIEYFAKENSIDYSFVEPVFYKPGTDEEERISSSYIRTMVLKRFFSTAEELLCRPYSMEISLDENGIADLKKLTQAVPPDGVYHCKSKDNHVRVEIKDGKLEARFEKSENCPKTGEKFDIEFN